jgi:hypothetical protein
MKANYLFISPTDCNFCERLRVLSSGRKSLESQYPELVIASSARIRDRLLIKWPLIHHQAAKLFIQLRFHGKANLFYFSEDGLSVTAIGGNDCGRSEGLRPSLALIRPTICCCSFIAIRNHGKAEAESV